MGYNLLINGGLCWGYNPLTNLLLTSWDIQVKNQFPVFFEQVEVFPGFVCFCLFKINFHVVFYSSIIFLGKFFVPTLKLAVGTCKAVPVSKETNRLPTIHVQVLKVATVDGSEMLMLVVDSSHSLPGLIRTIPFPVVGCLGISEPSTNVAGLDFDRRPGSRSGSALHGASARLSRFKKKPRFLGVRVGFSTGVSHGCFFFFGGD